MFLPLVLSPNTVTQHLKTLRLLLHHTYPWTLFVKTHQVFLWLITTFPLLSLQYCSVIRLGPLVFAEESILCTPFGFFQFWISKFRAQDQSQIQPARVSSMSSLFTDKNKTTLIYKCRALINNIYKTPNTWKTPKEHHFPFSLLGERSGWNLSEASCLLC